MGKKIGRPPLPRKLALGEVFSARLRVEEARHVKEAISKSGLARSEWIRGALLKVARGK
jgi:hypothetical protein